MKVLAIFSWRAIASQLFMCSAKPDINIECWLAFVRQEKNPQLDRCASKYSSVFRFRVPASLGRVPKLAVLYLPAYFLFLELYPFTPSKVAFFMASDSEPAIYVSGKAGQ